MSASAGYVSTRFSDCKVHRVNSNESKCKKNNQNYTRDD
jgi:hypothetical protein